MSELTKSPKRELSSRSSGKELSAARQIDYLRENGYNIRISHYRFCDSLNYSAPKWDMPEGHSVNNMGGSTSVVIDLPPSSRHNNLSDLREYDFDPTGSIEGVSVCSDKDNFCKGKGLKIALGRAIKKLRNNLSDEDLGNFNDIINQFFIDRTKKG